MGVEASRLVSEERGQASVEMAVVLPVVIIVAAIAMNALLFFSECASFDRIFRESVRAYATSPAYGQGPGDASGAVLGVLSWQFDEPYLNVSVSGGGGGLGLATYTGTLTFTPTLFGIGLKSEVFGVSLPTLTHQCVFTVDSYKPGVFF